MASRITNKINSQVLQKICKSLYSGSSESTAYPQSLSSDASAVTSTITSTSTLMNNGNNINIPLSTHTAIVPPTTPVTNPQPSGNCTQNQQPNTIGTDEQNLSCKDTALIQSSTANSLLQLSKVYQVCPDRARTVPMDHQIRKNQFNLVSLHKSVKMENIPLPTEHLQPGKQREFYVADATDINMPKASTEALIEAVAAASSQRGRREPSASETNGGYRKFAESMTYRNLTQPFKLSRLSNPFPDPVKEMPSMRISDQEKATQMYAESRLNSQAQAHFAQRQNQLKLKPQVPLQPSFTRQYSSQGKSGGRQKKFFAPNLKDCPKVKETKFKKLKTTQICPPVNPRTNCKSQTYIFKPCTKKEAPYPSYSETCHEEKPFVCRSCPWMSDVHPALKPKKKNYHTTSRSMSMSTIPLDTSLNANSGNSSHDMNDVNSISDNDGIIAMELKKRNRPKKPDCPKPPTALKRIPCAWVELDKKEDLLRSRVQPKKKPTTTKVEDESKNPPARKSAHVWEQLQEVEASKKVLKLEMSPRKVQITNKSNPLLASVNLQVDKKKQRLPTSVKSQETPAGQKVAADADSSSLYVYDGENLPEPEASHIPEDVAIPSAVGQSIDEWLAGLRPNKVETHSNVVTITSGGPCPKFPFKPLQFNLVINRKPKNKPNKCPKKSKLPKIADCPGRKDCLAELFDDVLVCKSKIKKSSKRPRKKPPQHPDHNSDNPCNDKRIPQSEICPGDLLTRLQKDKPGKKTKGNNHFEEAVAMLNSIERARSAPSMFKPHTFMEQQRK